MLVEHISKDSESYSVSLVKLLPDAILYSYHPITWSQLKIRVLTYSRYFWNYTSQSSSVIKFSESLPILSSRFESER